MVDCWRGGCGGCRGRGRSRLCLAGIKTSNPDLRKERRANTLGHVIYDHSGNKAVRQHFHIQAVN